MGLISRVSSRTYRGKIFKKEMFHNIRRPISTSQLLTSRIKLSKKNQPKTYANSKQPEQYVDFHVPNNPRPLARKDTDLNLDKIIRDKNEKFSKQQEEGTFYDRFIKKYLSEEYRKHRIGVLVLTFFGFTVHPDLSAYSWSVLGAATIMYIFET